MKSEFLISFTGLNEGHHQFHYEIKDTFFEQLDYSEIRKANLDVNIDLEKKTTMLVVNFEIKGQVTIMCDRCTDDFELSVGGYDELIYKFSEIEEDDEKVICIGSNETEIDVSQPIYEFTALLLPTKRLHPEGECNEEMLEVMDDYLMVESDGDETSNDEIEDDENIDPRWSALKKLKKK